LVSFRNSFLVHFPFPPSPFHRCVYTGPPKDIPFFAWPEPWHKPFLFPLPSTFPFLEEPPLEIVVYRVWPSPRLEVGLPCVFPKTRHSLPHLRLISGSSYDGFFMSSSTSRPPRSRRCRLAFRGSFQYFSQFSVIEAFEELVRWRFHQFSVLVQTTVQRRPLPRPTRSYFRRSLQSVHLFAFYGLNSDPAGS